VGGSNQDCFTTGQYPTEYEEYCATGMKIFTVRKSELYNNLIEFGRVDYVTNRTPMKESLRRRIPQW
jgi:hypothetical protein